MTWRKRTIMEMAREAWAEAGEGWVADAWFDDRAKAFEAFAELVREEAQAEEREKSLRLWMLLDDVDTADDIAKTDDAVYRSLCRQAHGKRWNVMTSAEVDAAIRARGQA